MEFFVPPDPEKRRGPRVPADFLVRIEGIHSEYYPTRGNISRTGVLLELPSAPGSPGDIELLHICSSDRERQAAVIGQIVRCVTIDTVGQRPQVAVVFEFLSERPEAKDAVAALIEHLINQSRDLEDFGVDHRIPVDLVKGSDAPREAAVFRLEVKRLLLETTWPVNLGDRVQLVFRGRNTRLPFEGRVVKSQPRPLAGAPLYDVEVALGAAGERAGPRPGELPSNTDSIDLILSEMLLDEPAPAAETTAEAPQRHLAGQLDHIPLPSLLTFLEMERQSGRLAVDDDDHTTLFLDHGQVVDVAPPQQDPRQRLESLLGRREGRFSFTCEHVQRTDRIRQLTTHILLDWARREDERNR